MTLGQGQCSYQVTLEPNRTKQRSVTQLEQVKSVAAIDSPEACLGGDMEHRALALVGIAALVSGGHPYPISCGHSNRVW